MLMMLTFASFAQKKPSVSKAEMLAKSGDLVEAMEIIEAATTHEKTKGKANTWVVRSKVYLGFLEAEDPGLQAKAPDAGKKFIESINKVKALDEKAYDSKIITDIPGIPSLKSRFMIAMSKKGVELQQKDPKGAYQAFAVLAEAFPNDTLSVKNAGLLALNAEMPKEAAMHFKALANIEGYDGSKAYELLLNAYQRAEDNENLISTAQEAMKKYPDNENFIIPLINYYIQNDKSKEAISMIEKALEISPKNVSYLYNLGLLYNQNGDEKKAQESFKKALEIDSNHFDSALGLALIPFNKGYKIVRELDFEVPTDANNKDRKAITGYYKEALPYLEKAVSVKDDNPEVLKALYAVYKFLGKKDEAKKIEDMMSN